MITQSLLLREPWLLLRIVLAKANLALRPLPRTLVRRRINGVHYEFDFSDAALLDNYQFSQPAMKAMLFGAYEPLLLRAMRRLLRPGGTFVDVGANIGYISTIGAGLVGAEGQVHSFEPVPKYFRRLERLAALNPDRRIHVNQCALGEKSGVARIRLDPQNIGGNTLVADAPEQASDTVEVPVRRLDDYIAEKRLESVSLIKIDVEGFEFPVLKGMSGYFESAEHRPPILCEINPGDAERFGYSLAEMSEHMGRLGYAAYSLARRKERIDITRLKHYVNVLFAAGDPRI